jgi:hypothetical protein
MIEDFAGYLQDQSIYNDVYDALQLICKRKKLRAFLIKDPANPHVEFEH